MKKVLLFVLLCLVSLSVHADWSIKKSVDPMTDEVTPYAYTFSRPLLKVGLFVWDANGMILAVLKPSDPDHKLKLLWNADNSQLDMRVDQNDAHRLEVRMGDDGYSMSVRLTKAIVRELASGARLVVRDPTGKLIEFSLKDSAKSLRGVLGSF